MPEERSIDAAIQEILTEAERLRTIGNHKLIVSRRKLVIYRPTLLQAVKWLGKGKLGLFKTFLKETPVLGPTLVRLHRRYRQGQLTIFRSPAFHEATTAVSTVARPEDRKEMDRFYLEFENAFRGSEAKIRERLDSYLSYYASSPLDFTKETTLDIGCGRGEWLSLLAEQGFRAMGVDLSQRMVKENQKKGHHVVEADALSYLRAQEPASLGAVTGFHVVEHLGFETLFCLFRECHRVLKPGGLVIFETPNPENLIVGACNFYTDPTHERPIPPTTLHFLADFCGFRPCRIVRLHAMIEANQPESVSKDLADIRARLFGPQDYALVALKPHA